MAGVSGFLKLCNESGYSVKEQKQFQIALELAQKQLTSKQRFSGDTFFDHNLRVGVILVQHRSSSDAIMVGILHGLDNDKKFITETFGEHILKLLDEVEEVKIIKGRNKNLEAETLRRIILTTLKDPLVILVKLANKLDNLRTISALPEEKQKRISEEVLDFYAPLAYRLGVEKIRVELENLAFKVLNPRRYNEISKYLEQTQEQREKNVQGTIRLIKKLVQKDVKIIKIKGRPKHVYSIYKKVKKKNKKLEEIYDLIGIRIITKEIKDCYTLLGLLHQEFEPLKGRLKDYIANPKANYYRSIHTGLKLPNDKVAEIQIRTEEMNEFAEEGLAAHWRYKGVKSTEMFEKKVAWLKEILESQKGTHDKEFLEVAKVDVFGDLIYCYTPKGDIRELPVGAMILDFAFSVHEQVGTQTIGARVNGKFVPLRHVLKQGDVVEILTNKNQRPRRSWVKIVKSAKSRQKIRKHLRTHEKLPAPYYRRIKPETTEGQGILVESDDFPNAVCVLAKCCHPSPAENIAGIVTKRKVISVHQTTCRQALKEEDRWVVVTWKTLFNQKIKFFVQAHERSGLLADLLHTIANAGFNIKEAKAKLIDRTHAECSFSVIPRDLDHLVDLVKRVKKVKGTTNVFFE